MTPKTKNTPHILCISWDPALSWTRQVLLTRHGYKVTSAMGEHESMERCTTKADLLLLGHSVPRTEKQKILECFRKFNSSPALSLLAHGQAPLPDVEYAVEVSTPDELLNTVEQIIRPA